ncbi:Lrp/AsnC family transcriptional regulator [Mycolicibacterium sp. GCM10028919]|jgi:DNA-binding Lrp family transcriptional regulator|uniref:AsnC family transcriptional regulator n=1 Tax=Mycolicibacterium arabiense TaxID=1286181 RepID=A0A7I7S1F5_9MYCO|nr:MULTISPECIES: Lrp/AsnC family transcriptional regulator [Mycolicibacterium]MCV7371839.1 Lrp/AsnC family transcriptional regulator [Mycolicibacterium arabiense]BBY50553.1 AsnC family transcriptional regulator [Mycolicibacterium arabiense]
MTSLDRLDLEILRKLSDDARTGVVELSSALGISRNTVQSRVRRLEESGVLTGYQPRVDLAEAGLAVQAFVALEINQVGMASVVSGLARIPQVLEVHATTGREDLLVRVATATQAELQELVVHILAIPGVVHSSTTLALTTPLPYRVIPLLEEATRDAGWGRSTPKP